MTNVKPKGIAPGWVLVYFGTKEWLAHVPWDTCWHRFFDWSDAVGKFLANLPLG